METTAPRVALHKDFLPAFSDLPKKIQKKVRDFLDKFQSTPTRSGLNFERIQKAVDPKVRSVRIDQAYRAIVIHPPKGDLYLVVWVDHHDDAYRWVQNRRFEVNPTTGVFQVFEQVEMPREPAAAPAATGAATGLFAEHDEEELILLGVPVALLPAVLAVQTEHMLDDLAPHLPEDAAEGLYALASGCSVEEAFDHAAAPKEKPVAVDTEDFSAAMEKPASQRQIKVIEDTDEMTAILDAPMAQWRVFLHPSQRKIVEVQAKGPYRVLGGAGTGKTVVLMHRARYLARQLRDDPEGRILVTTFTRNLAGDLENNLRELCGEEFKRLEVVNLHSWAAQFLRKQGRKLDIVDDQEQEKWMDTAMVECGAKDHSLAFYRAELDRVAQPQDVLTREDYFRARRVGRGTPLGRRQRAEVWEVLARYREMLHEEGKMEWQDAVREARMLIEKRGLSLTYRAVLADEVQDFSAGDLRLLRAMVPEGDNDLFLVGDGHQRIYGQPTSLSSCGIRIIGRSRRLRLNYRTTDAIARHSLAILKDCDIDDLDEGVDTLRGYTSLRKGVEPVIRQFADAAEEGEFVVQQVREWLDRGLRPEEVCIAVRLRKDARGRYRQLLEAAGIESTVLEKDNEPEAPGVRVATMHRMKGLEFRGVLLASVQEGMMPYTGGGSGNLSEDRLLQERCLFYVASTRARDELVITGYGNKSNFLAE